MYLLATLFSLNYIITHENTLKRWYQHIVCISFPLKHKLVKFRNKKVVGPIEVFCITFIMVHWSCAPNVITTSRPYANRSKRTIYGSINIIFSNQMQRTFTPKINHMLLQNHKVFTA